MKRKQRLIIGGVVILALIAVYFCTKIFFYNYYEVKSFKETLNANTIQKEKWESGKKVLNNNKYVKINGLKLENKFEDFKYTHNLNKDDTHHLYEKDDASVRIQGLSEPGLYTFFTIEDSDENIYKKKLTSADLKKFFDENNIQNDYDFLLFLDKYKEKRFNIFTSISDMKEGLIISFISNFYPLVSTEFTLINGQNEGIFYNVYKDSDITGRELMLYKGRVTYHFYFNYGEVINDEFVKSLVESAIIE